MSKKQLGFCFDEPVFILNKILVRKNLELRWYVCKQSLGVRYWNLNTGTKNLAIYIWKRTLLMRWKNA
jgi:hypothetical protein